MLACKCPLSLGICVIYTFTLFNLQAQKPFDIIPNMGGINGQSQAWTLLLDSNKFYLVGDLLDTLIDGSPVVIPWVSELNYDGEIESTRMISDESIENPFRVSRNAIFKNLNDKLWIYGSQKFTEGTIRPKLIEVDPTTGEINKSIYINNPIDSSISLSRKLMTVSDSLIVLSSFYWTGNHYHLNLILLDHEMNILNSFVLSNADYNNIVYYVEIETDSTLLIIGDSRLASDQSNFPQVKPFLSRITFEGEIIFHAVASSLPEKTVTFPLSYTSTVTRDDMNNWVMSCVSVVETHLCNSCHYLVPYTFSLSPNFDSLIWLTKFPGLAPQNNSQAVVSSSLKCLDNSGFITSGFDWYSFIYKVNNLGDSLWLRKYKTLNWDDDRTAWNELVDLKATNHNTYILAGRVSDSDFNVIRSWVIQIDSVGCIIPGCNSTVGTSFNNDFKEDFLIYPNPTSNILYVMNLNLAFVHCKLTISSSNGQHLKSTEFDSSIGEQYILDLAQLPRGAYIVTISDNLGGILVSKQIILQ